METEIDHRSTKTSLPAPSTQQRISTPAIETAAILTRLALHYWRPDFTPAQTKLLIQDYLADLAEFTPEQINQACVTYRRKPDSKFFPHIGELLAILRPEPEKSEPRSRLPIFRGWPALEGPRAVKSVAEVLREHGFDRAAASWER